jgi:negative regulator of flagellin synthesis FlgM
MTDPISHFGRIAQMDTSVRKVAAKGEQSADKAKATDVAASATGQSDELHLSEVARQATQEPHFDRAKVEAIKRAIQQGQYPLDVRRIAESFVAIENMIKG